MLKKMLNFFLNHEKIYAGYTLKGKALNSNQAGSFTAPVFYAANNNIEFRKLVQQNKYLFMQGLPSDNYYDAAVTTMIALETL